MGGERAAGHLTGGLRTEHATLHIPAGTQLAIAKALKLAPDADGPMTLLERFGKGDEYRFPDLPGVPLMHPILVWAECLMVPDERVTQVARQLHDQLLQDARG
jgi:Transcriptional regulator, AbiEi antitoxin, Type IV TA system